MYSRHHRKARVLFGVMDAVLTAIAFEAAYRTRLLLPYFEREFEIALPVKALLLGFSVLLWIALGYWLGVYDRLDSARIGVIFRDTTRQSALGGMCVVLFEYTLRLDLSRSFLLFFALTSWALLLLFRWKAGSVIGLIRREFVAPHQVLIAGTGPRAKRLGELLKNSTEHDIRVLGYLDEGGDAPEAASLSPVYSADRLPELLRQQVIDEILFAVDSSRLAQLEDIFLLCDEEGVRTRVAVDFFPHVNSDIYLDRYGELPLLTFAAAPHDEIRLLIKRLIDFLIAATMLCLLLPLILVIVVLVKVTSPGPAIFSQIRCGLNGRRFVFYKFRSMVHNAEQLRESLEAHNAKNIAFKMPNDPRMTGVGRWLRKFSIDEWPQLWNVLKGDMSLVGPRPAIPSEVERYERWQRRRLRMRPGLTCLWAIQGRDKLDFDTWMRLDMQYIDNWSLALDGKIILRTVPYVLLGKGAH